MGDWVVGLASNYPLLLQALSLVITFAAAIYNNFTLG